MDPAYDLVDHFKLEADFADDYTLHTYHKSDRSQGLRKIKVLKKWSRRESVGEGNFGTVWLEVEEDGSERAVKAISRRLCARNSIDYKKELAALAKLSKVRLYHTRCCMT